MKHNTNINLNGFRIKSEMKQLESGRSMIETIGVLAVMGVLTIGGIAGYNYAINKHRANQVLQDIRLIYQETKYPNTVRQIVETGSFPDLELDTQSSYEYSFTFPDLKDFIYDSTSETVPNLISVNVSGVPDTACDILLKTKPEYVLMLKANGQSVWSCDKDENELSYIFEITSDKLEHGTCSVCTDNHCFDDDSRCPQGENCQNDVCSKCNPGQTLWQSYDGEEKCVSCHTSYTNKFTVEYCNRCNDTIHGYLMHQGNGCMGCQRGIIRTTEENCTKRCSHIQDMNYIDEYCFSCSGFDYLFNFSQDKCNVCPQTIWYPFTENGSKNLCIQCSNRITNATTNKEKTECMCPNGQFWNFATGNQSYCSDCSINLEYYSNKTECDKCPQRYYDIAKGGNDRYGLCKLCPTGQVKDTSAEGDGRKCVNAPAN
ncbi:MAG: hypothetical protein IKY98_03020 [Alphaproteobacteria bacterium]|nr:hypothetical protein [Alphaproteobacteria bacterium]